MTAEGSIAMPDRLGTLLPYPVRVGAMPGESVLGRDTQVTGGPRAQREAEAVRRVVTAIPWPAEGRGRGAEILVDIDAAVPAEGYRLLITPDRVKINASDPAGAFYAAQTIRQ